MSSDEEEIDFSDDDDDNGLIVPIILPADVQVKEEPNNEVYEIDQIQSESEGSTVNYADERIIDEANVDIKEELIEEIQLDDEEVIEEEDDDEPIWEAIRDGHTTWPCSQCNQLVPIQPLPACLTGKCVQLIAPLSKRKRPTLLKLDGLSSLLAHYNMFTHQLGHSETFKPTYKCTACPFQAQTYLQLKNHYASRLNNPDLCAYVSKRLETLKETCLTSLNERGEKYKYACGHCEWRKTSRSATTLVEHLLNEHVKKDHEKRIKCTYASPFGTTCHVTQREIEMGFGLGPTKPRVFERLLKEHRYHHAITELGQLFLANMIYFGSRKCTRYCGECYAFFATPAEANKHANQHHKYLRPGAPFTSRMDVTQLEAALDEFKASFVVYMDKELQKPKPKPKRPLNNPFASTRTRRIQRPNKVIAKRSTTMVKTKTTAATASFDSQLGLWFCNLCPFNSPKKWPMNRHMQNEHNIPLPHSVATKPKKTKAMQQKTFIPFVCIECHAEFIDRKYLNAHNCDGVLIKNKRTQ